MLKNLRERRLDLGLTMKDVAKGVGISHVYYTKLERGERRMNVELAKRIAYLLDMKIDDMIK